MTGGNPLRTTGVSDQGRSFYKAALEARFELTDLHYFTWKKAPLFPKYFRNLEYGLGAEIFFEGGDVYNDPSEAGLAELKLGYGAGLLLRLPYVEVTRLELYFNPDRALKEYSYNLKTDISF
jgi:hypothetical protein